MTAWRDRNVLLRAAALLALAAGAMLPPVTMSRPVYTVLAVLDITLSMNVRDQTIDGAPASRIDAEKRAMKALLRRLPCGSRLGAAIFVERQPFLLFEPVETCENFSALDAEIGAIDWRMGWDSESHIAEGFVASLRMARALGADLLFLTDGQETPPLSWEAQPDVASLRDAAHGVIFGVGGRTFSPIPKYDSLGHEIGVYKAGDVPSETAGMFRGREHLSAVDEPHLRALAAQTGLAYGHLDGGLDMFAAYSGAVRPLQRTEPVSLAWIAQSSAFVLAMIASLPRASKNLLFLKKKKQKDFMV